MDSSEYKAIMDCKVKNIFPNKMSKIKRKTFQRRCKYFEVVDNLLFYLKPNGKKALVLQEGDYIEDIVKGMHIESGWGRHRGLNQTLKELNDQYYWRNMSQAVMDCINNCDVCSQKGMKIKVAEERTLNTADIVKLNSFYLEILGPFQTKCLQSDSYFNDSNSYAFCSLENSTRSELGNTFQTKCSRTHSIVSSGRVGNMDTQHCKNFEEHFSHDSQDGTTSKLCGAIKSCYVAILLDSFTGWPAGSVFNEVPTANDIANFISDVICSQGFMYVIKVDSRKGADGLEDECRVDRKTMSAKHVKKLNNSEKQSNNSIPLSRKDVNETRANEQLDQNQSHPTSPEEKKYLDCPEDLGEQIPSGAGKNVRKRNRDRRFDNYPEEKGVSKPFKKRLTRRGAGYHCVTDNEHKKFEKPINFKHSYFSLVLQKSLDKMFRTPPQVQEVDFSLETDYDPSLKNFMFRWNSHFMYCSRKPDRGSDSMTVFDGTEVFVSNSNKTDTTSVCSDTISSIFKPSLPAYSARSGHQVNTHEYHGGLRGCSSQYGTSYTLQNGDVTPRSLPAQKGHETEKIFKEHEKHLSTSQTTIQCSTERGSNQTELKTDTESLNIRCTLGAACINWEDALEKLLYGFRIYYRPDGLKSSPFLRKLLMDPAEIEPFIERDTPVDSCFDSTLNFLRTQFNFEC